MARKPIRPDHLDFGSIVSGTMRPEDVAPALADALEPFVRGKRNRSAEREHIRRARSRKAIAVYGAELVSDLIDALSDFAPPYAYVGTHPGDGADFGVWLDEEFRQLILDDDGIAIDAGDPIPTEHVGYVLETNDHGNATLRFRHGNGRVRTIWSVV